MTDFNHSHDIRTSNDENTQPFTTDNPRLTIDDRSSLRQDVIHCLALPIHQSAYLNSGSFA